MFKSTFKGRKGEKRGIVDLSCPECLSGPFSAHVLHQNSLVSLFYRILDVWNAQSLSVSSLFVMSASCFVSFDSVKASP